MKLHKGLFLFGASALLLVGCGTEVEEAESEMDEIEEVAETEEEEPSQEELNSELKEEAKEIDFVTANGGGYELGTPVYAEGEISSLTEDLFDEFMLSVQTDTGYGMYTVTSINTTDVEYANGDTIQVYGRYDGEDENTGMPLISSPFVEEVGEADE